jgi:ribosomal protein S18 acetylase RimI-like enzyme
LGAAETELAAAANAEWLTTLAMASGHDEKQRKIYRQIVANLHIPAVFATTRIDGAPVSVAYGAMHGGLVAIESVATKAAFRRQGLARHNVSAVLAWARERGAEGACLQVEAGNAPARALYEAVGFRTLLYRYHYRRKQA